MRRESSLLVKQQAVRPLRPGVQYSGFVLLAKGSFNKISVFILKNLILKSDKNLTLSLAILKRQFHQE